MRPRARIGGTAAVAAACRSNADRPSRPLGWLLFGDGSTWPVHANVILGRSPLLTPGDLGSADMVAFDDPTMSRRHLLVDVEGVDGPRFVDLESRGGSWLVVGERIAAPLSPSVPADADTEVCFGAARVRWMTPVAPALDVRSFDGSVGPGGGDLDPRPGRTGPPSVETSPFDKDAENR